MRSCFGESGQTRRVGATEVKMGGDNRKGAGSRGLQSPLPLPSTAGSEAEALHPKHGTSLWPTGPPGETVPASVLLLPLRAQSRTGAVGGCSRQECVHFVHYSWLLFVYGPPWENMLLTRVADSRDSQPSEYTLSDADFSWLFHET